MLRRGGATLVVLWLLGLAMPASADPLAKAKAAVASSDYLNAGPALDEALAAGTLGPEQVAEIYRLRGIVAGALGDAAAATAAFERCLALAPKAELPPGTSPKIARPFAAAQELAKQREPLHIKAETAASPPAVTVLIASDPLAMIARVRVAVVVDGAPEQQLEGTGKDRVTIALPAGARLDLRIAALDERGNRLAELGTRDVPIVIVGTGAKPPRKGGADREVGAVVAPPRAPPRARPLGWKWWLWGTGAVVVAGAATYFGIDALRAKDELDELNANSPSHTFDEAQDVEARARRGVLFANIGYGVAGALAITATILFLTEPDAPTRERNTAVRAVPIPGGGALVLGGHF